MSVQARIWRIQYLIGRTLIALGAAIVPSCSIQRHGKWRWIREDRYPSYIRDHQ